MGLGAFPQRIRLLDGDFLPNHARPAKVDDNKCAVSLLEHVVEVKVVVDHINSVSAADSPVHLARTRTYSSRGQQGATFPS